MSEQPVNNNTRTAKGRFGPNNPGRPLGSKNKRTLLVQQLMSGDAEAIVQSVISAAKSGDMTAARLVLERIAPAPKDAPVNVALPPLTGAQDAPTFARALVEAAARGELTPAEADALMGLLGGFVRAAELADIEARISALEAAHGDKR